MSMMTVHQIRVGLVLSLLALCCGVSAAADPTTRPGAPVATLSAETDGPLLAGLPVLLKLTLTNTGPAPFSYWCGGPGRYPSASTFSVAVTDVAGKTRTFRLHNGQYVQGSGNNVKVETKQALPAAFDPLPPGRYTLKVTGRPIRYLRDGKEIVTWPETEAEPITIEMKDDPQELPWAEFALGRRGLNDPFARHVSETYGIARVVDKWMDQLLDDDPKIAFDAVGYLQHVRRLPTARQADLPRAAEKHCHPKSGEPDKNLLWYIAQIGANLKTDSALDAVAIIALADVDPYADEGAAGALGEFPQAKAEELLLDLAARENYPGRWSCLSALARHHHPAALVPLLLLAKDRDSPRRDFALFALGGLRDQTAARDTLNAAVHDPDERIRGLARRALEENNETQYAP